MRGEGILSTGDEGMARFLSREGAVSGNQRFVTRNFLLDEGVSDDRFRSYQSADCVAEHASFADWKGRHEKYLHEQIAKAATSDRHQTLDARDADACPETFRMMADDSYHTSDPKQHLIRVVSLSFIKEKTGISLANLKQWAERVVAASPDRRIEEHRLLDDALKTWNEAIDSWPTFAAFWEDVRGLWEPTEQPDWADQLRDWLGLAHLCPAQRGLPEIDMLVLRYPISAVPKLSGSSLSSGSRPWVSQFSLAQSG
jgi:hypothetical protein